MRPLRGAISTAASTTGRKYHRNSGLAKDMVGLGVREAPASLLALRMTLSEPDSRSVRNAAAKPRTAARSIA
ncbi:hypothetical protein GCM10010470_27130 [Saccharopolyspora taberi]|uniref:Uncharacterized protein n=1 Tax=Saccharopolyspora taberi TaxID=60895 RepID=A0ABN3VCY1_9PSEU